MKFFKLFTGFIQIFKPSTLAELSKDDPRVAISLISAAFWLFFVDLTFLLFLKKGDRTDYY